MPADGLFVLEHVEKPAGSVFTYELTMVELTVCHELYGKAFCHQNVILIGCLSRLLVQEALAMVGDVLAVCSPWRP